MDEFIQFTKEFYNLTGVDLTLYKRPQMERRLTSLRNKHGFSDFRSYLRAVAAQPVLLAELMDKMTINVSEFFRNPERWQALAPLLENMSANPLRAWSAACSTGEEPYTLSILMSERFHRPIEITATDIDKNALHLAEQGQYKEHQVKSLDDRQRATYFTQTDGIWTVKDAIRRNVSFGRHNLLADPYPREFDLIICRNVMIYFTDAAKQQVIAGFSKSLKPGGILFVGSTEQFLRTDHHGLVSAGPFLYRKQA